MNNQQYNQIHKATVNLWTSGKGLTLRFSINLNYSTDNGNRYIHNEYISRGKDNNGISVSRTSISLQPNTLLHLKLNVDNGPNNGFVPISRTTLMYIKSHSALSNLIFAILSYNYGVINLITDTGKLNPEYTTAMSPIILYISNKYNIKIEPIIKYNNLLIEFTVNGTHTIELAMYQFLELFATLSECNINDLTMQMINYVQRPDYGTNCKDLRSAIPDDIYSIEENKSIIPYNSGGSLDKFKDPVPTTYKKKQGISW